MSPKEIATLKLLKNNYKIFLPLNSPSDELVIFYKDKPQLCLVKLTRETKRGPNLLYGNIIDFSIYNYVIAVEKETKRTWLIPIADIDLDKKSMMLSAYANHYSLVPQNLSKTVVEKKREITVAKVTEKVVKENKVKTRIETNEDILNLLSKG